MNLKFIWGPIGQHSKVPYGYLKSIPFKYFFLDRFRSVIRFLFRSFDPFFHLTKIKSKLILTINKETSKYFNIKKTNILPAISVNPDHFMSYRSNDKQRNTFEVYWAGNFIYWKGIDIVIDSFNKFSSGKNDVILNLIGDGDELNRIKIKAKANNKLNLKENYLNQNCLILFRNKMCFLSFI